MLGRITLAAALLGAVAAANTAEAKFVVTYNGAGVEGPDAAALCSGPGICTIGTETFDGRPTGGGQTFTSDYGLSGGIIQGAYNNVQINGSDVYGGAGNTGNYAVTFSGAGYSVDLSTSLKTGINYFGYWLSALDAGNQVRFYKGGHEVFTFNPTNVLALVGQCVNNNPYCGKPGQGGNDNQPYVFLNFFDIGQSFDRIVFSENPNGGGYESDNHTVGYATNTPGHIVGIPEPASMGLLGAGLMGLGLLRRARRD